MRIPRKWVVTATAAEAIAIVKTCAVLDARLDHDTGAGMLAVPQSEYSRAIRAVAFARKAVA